MKFTETELKGLYVIDVMPFEDERGLFFRTYCLSKFKAIGMDMSFVQINQSVNYQKGTFRGLHYNNSSFGDEKLIRCITGKVFDIVVDLRKSSKTFLRHFTIELSSTNRKMLLVPSGCAHGFLTLENNSELIYHHTSFYNSNHDAGINYKDSKINLDLPYPINVISKKDSSMPFLDREFEGI